MGVDTDTAIRSPAVDTLRERRWGCEELGGELLEAGTTTAATAQSSAHALSIRPNDASGRVGFDEKRSGERLGNGRARCSCSWAFDTLRRRVKGRGYGNGRAVTTQPRASTVVPIYKIFMSCPDGTLHDGPQTQQEKRHASLVTVARVSVCAHT